METLDKKLPIWLCGIETGDTSERLDNNWYSPAAAAAVVELRKSTLRGAFKVVTLESLCEPDGINPGKSPVKGGTIGVVEGKNLRSNYVIPMFMKYTKPPFSINVGDLFIGKDGEPGVVAVVTADLLEYYPNISAGGHVYHVRPQQQYRELAPFISAFLNSRNGQALIRKLIAGGTTPTIRKADLAQLPILIPANEKCPRDVWNSVIQTQKRVIETMDNLGPSKGIAEKVGMREVDVRLPTNWAGAGGQRSSRLAE